MRGFPATSSISITIPDSKVLLISGFGAFIGACAGVGQWQQARGPRADSLRAVNLLIYIRHEVGCVLWRYLHARARVCVRVCNYCS